MIFHLVLFERGQNSEQDECVFMQFNSNSRPRAPFEARKFKKLFLVKISRNLPEKGLKRSLNIAALIHGRRLIEDLEGDELCDHATSIHGFIS